MNIIRYNKPMYSKNFNNVIDSVFGDLAKEVTSNNFNPKVCISENENSFTINAELPGVKKENIHVDLEENSLTISGDKKNENEIKDNNYHLIESTFGSFSRTFYLPDNTNKENIEANFEDGILMLSIPKEEVKKISNRIKVN